MAKEKQINLNKKTYKMELMEGYGFKGFVSSPQVNLNTIPFNENGMRTVNIHAGLNGKGYPEISVTQTDEGNIYVNVTSFIPDSDENQKMTHEADEMDDGTMCHDNEITLQNKITDPRLYVLVRNFVYPENKKDGGA